MPASCKSASARPCTSCSTGSICSAASLAPCTKGNLATPERRRKRSHGVFAGEPRSGARGGPERACGCQPDASRPGARADALAHAQRLAMRAEIRAAAALDDALDGRSAVLAWLSSLVVDEED